MVGDEKTEGQMKIDNSEIQSSSFRNKHQMSNI